MVPFSKEHLRLLLNFELAHVADQGGNAQPAFVRPRLVLGLAANYGKADIFVFVNSLRGVGYVGDVVLLVTTLDEDTRSFLKSKGVQVVSAWQSLFSKMNVQFARHSAYYDYLTNLANQGIYYERILVTDVSDVAFQDDPFRSAGEAPMVCYLEHPSVTIGSCESNRWWVEEGFGPNILAELADKPISCSGTVIATMTALRSYLLKMLHLSTYLSDHMIGARGIDQGVHNVLIHRGELEGVRLAENGDGVFTMFWSISRNEVFVSEDGTIRDQNDNAPEILHQYTRNDTLAMLLRRKWAS